MKTAFSLVAVTGLMLTTMAQPAAAQFPFFNFLNPYQSRMNYYPVNNYPAGVGYNQVARPTVPYGVPSSCPNGFCGVPQNSVSCRNGVCSPMVGQSNCPNGMCSPCVNGNCNVRPMTPMTVQPYGGNNPYYGGSTMPVYVPSNVNVNMNPGYTSPYRDRNLVPTNYYPAPSQPYNNYYLGQLR